MPTLGVYFTMPETMRLGRIAADKVPSETPEAIVQTVVRQWLIDHPEAGA